MVGVRVDAKVKHYSDLTQIKAPDLAESIIRAWRSVRDACRPARKGRSGSLAEQHVPA